MAIPLHKRRKVADFDPVRDGKTITQFCKELGISRQTYINIKNRVAQKGRSGIVPDSTAPKNPARKFDDTDKVAVVNARQHLMEQGLDYGPWSIYYYLFDSIGPERTPSRSTIASWLHELGFVDANARKRPRSSYKRFARDFVGELWQIDGLVYRLFDHAHTQVTIYQIIDDASRFDVGTKAFPLPENGTDARAVLAEAFATYGKPQEILSDNGEAFATYHRGHLSATELWLASEGVLAIAGFAATTQGKDERSHRTLTQFLDVRHPVSLAEVNTYLAEYRHVYNERRRHQSLLVGKMHITPRQAFDTFPKATPPTH
ncbi:transposase, partial [Corynebacterium sp. CCUG 59401]|nr:transposase [Corynebacterium pseudogenitalium]